MPVLRPIDASGTGIAGPSVFVGLMIGVIMAGVGVSFSADSIGTAVEPDRDVPSFYVRAVTGPLAGKSVCYVCRNGDRPVVMILLKELSADATALLKDLDRTVDRHRAEGLRCFVVLLSEMPTRDSAHLQTLAFDEKIGLPLTVTTETTLQGSSVAMSQESKMSVILYQDRRIVEQFSYQAGTCDRAARASLIVASENLIHAANSSSATGGLK